VLPYSFGHLHHIIVAVDDNMGFKFDNVDAKVWKHVLLGYTLFVYDQSTTHLFYKTKCGVLII